MSQSLLSEIEAHEVSMEILNDPEGIIVRIAGSADSRVKDDLQAVLLDAHQKVQALHLPRITIDLCALDFMNSSCFKAFVYWLAEARNLEQSNRYRIHFLANQDIHWQRRSLRALSCFAAGLVQIDPCTS